jgi:hypothetical protein
VLVMQVQRMWWPQVCQSGGACARDTCTAEWPTRLSGDRRPGR